jgi:alpha-tubulin suppressor-like RCC1 family protein
VSGSTHADVSAEPAPARPQRDSAPQPAGAQQVGRRLGDDASDGRSAPPGSPSVIDPARTSSDRRAIAIATGSDASDVAVITAGGTVQTWGDNTYGEFGNGTTNRYGGSNTPATASTLSGVSAIAAGDEYSLAINGDQHGWGRGVNYDGQLGSGNTTQQTSPVQTTVPPDRAIRTEVMRR